MPQRGIGLQPRVERGVASVATPHDLRNRQLLQVHRTEGVFMVRWSYT